jgi:predicted unusual protein kinase regulating ubiquinone biosynthesis (AarF/ABC1/UbiB family)
MTWPRGRCTRDILAAGKVRDAPYIRQMTDVQDPERDRLSARLGRAANLGANLAGAAAAAGAARLLGGADADAQIAAAIKAALGRSKGPLLKVAQMMATIPDFLPPEYAAQLSELQTNAPAMGWPFVQRRMRAELGPGWDAKFKSFSREAVAAASLGQVHKAEDHDGRLLACKLQYPDMASAVESDLSQLQAILGLVKRLGRIVDPSAIGVEIGDRLREELDYEREAKHMALYRAMLAHEPAINTPDPAPALSAKRLLTMTWLDGRPLKHFLSADQDIRNHIATLLFKAWWGPLARYGVLHGDPHLGNYTFSDDGARLNLLDFGCVRIFPPNFVAGVVLLRNSLRDHDAAGVREAYRVWGFDDLNDGTVEALTIWARFIYGPMLEDRVRPVAENVAPGEYGRREVIQVKNMLRTHGPVTIPREFVFMDRAAIGLGSALLHLRAEINFCALFDAEVAGFDVTSMGARQTQALAEFGLT